MKILVFDTETGGLNADLNDILQLSYQVVTCYRGICCGMTFETTKEVNHFFPWPENRNRVQWGAIQVNGLTEEYLATKTLSDRYHAIEEFYNDMGECDYIVAHNGEFDRKFIIATAEREGYMYATKGWKPMIDTMKSTTDICKIPSRSGRPGYKWPKLIELAECLDIKTDDINLHDSSADVELTKRCFLYLLQNGFYTI